MRPETAMGTNFTIDRAAKTAAASKVFAAPREQVWKAWADPKILAQWWGPKGYTTIVDKMIFQPGGPWRFIQLDEDGNRYAFNGRYEEIVEPERIVYTFEYEGALGRISKNTVAFEESSAADDSNPSEPRTRVTVTSSFAILDDLDRMIDAGMEKGARESLDRAAEAIARM